MVDNFLIWGEESGLESVLWIMEECKISEKTARELLEALVKNGEIAKLCVESSREALGNLGISNNDNDKKFRL